MSGNQREGFEEAARRFREAMDELYPGPGQAQARLAQIEAHEVLGAFRAGSRESGAQQDEVIRKIPVPGARRELSGLFQRVRAEFDREGREAGQRAVTNRQIARLAYQSSRAHFIPNRPDMPLAKVPADGHMAGVLRDFAAVESVAAVRNLAIPGPPLAFHIVKGLGGTQRDALLAWELAERARAELGEWRAGAGAGTASPLQPDGQLRAVVEAILPYLVPASKRGPRGRFPAAVELALCRAIVAFATGDGKAGLAWPLLDPEGFLAAPEVAEVLARALTGGHLEGASLLGRAWAEAFLDGTLATELTADAGDLLGFLWREAQELRPLTDLAGSRSGAAPEPEQEKELRRRLSEAREALADFDRVSAFDIGRPARSLPPELRPFLRNQVPLLAEASRGFVGRKWLLADVDAFIEGDEDGYCFILAMPGVGKTALLAHLVARRPGYARHFNVLSEGVYTTEQFLNNVCAQLIGAYRLDPGQFPRSGGATADLLLRLLEQSAAKARGSRVVVVIDALDEAMLEPRLPGVNPLSLPSSLPEGCRFIVTARGGTERWEPTLDADCAVRFLRIDVGGEQNMNDARVYVRSRLASPGITRYLLRHGLAGAEFAEELAARSQGSFLYLRHLLDQFDADGDLADLPAGLKPYYEAQYERMRAGTPQREWDRIQFPVLAELAVARRPLTVDELRTRAGLGPHDIAAVMSAIRQWQHFLVGSHASTGGQPVRAYRLFHESFREFLEETVVPDSVVSGTASVRAGLPRPTRPGN